MSHGSEENEEEVGNPYLQCCYLPPSEEKRVLWIQWIIYQLIDQAKAALPVVTFVFFFMLIILGQTPSDVMELSYGMLFVIVGLVFFMYGLEFGVMPMGDKIGMLLPTKVHWAVMYFIAGIIGIAVTYAEPAIGVLKTAAQLVREGNAPYLFDLLVKRQNTLIFAVALGVGLSTWLGMLRIVKKWSIKPLIYVCFAIALGLTVIVEAQGTRRDILGLAWDMGAVTTGPVTVPLVISLGNGIAASVGVSDNPLNGFGVVTLASVIPAIVVLLLGLMVPEVKPGDGSVEQNEEEPWGVEEILSSTRAMVPLIVALIILLKLVVRYQDRVMCDVPKESRFKAIQFKANTYWGLAASYLGIWLFFVGLTHGLSKIAFEAGSILPSAFTKVEGVESSPIWSPSTGKFVVMIFSFSLGFCATLAEPALNALGISVEKVTNGNFPKAVVMYSVAFGVAFGISAGVLKILQGWNLTYMLLITYAIAIALTVVSDEAFTCVAWDSAGTTTSEVTVPIVLAIGLGIGKAINVQDTFGILSMASVFPIISVLVAGIGRRIKKGTFMADVRQMYKNDKEAAAALQHKTLDEDDAGGDAAL